MVRINLLKQTSHAKREGRFPVLPVVGGFVAVAVMVSIVMLLTTGTKHPPTKVNVAVAPVPNPKIVTPAPVSQPVVEKMVAPETKAVQKPAAKQATAAVPVQTATKSAFAEKTLPKPVAEPVRETVKPAAAKTSVAQEALINYNIAFAGRLFEKLTEAVPEGIGFGSLSVDSFATVSGTGLAPTRGIVSTLFTHLRSRPFHLRELPSSYIESADRGYRFQFVCDASFVDDPVDPAVKPVSLTKLTAYIRTFTTISARDGLYSRQGLVRRSAKKSGDYTQVVYQFSCSGTYRNFVKYVLDLDKAHVPCAFSTVRIKARSEAIVDMSADVVFTTRH